MMRAMILAAGRGERMRPLTDKTPKPLLEVGGKPLLAYHLQRLADAGYRDIVINIAYLGEQIRAYVGDGSKFGVHVRYSEEATALETGGGIYNALPWLNDDLFLVINGDIWCDHTLAMPKFPRALLAHLVMVDNPAHHPQGDFFFDGRRLNSQGEPKLTFSGIGWYRAELFSSCTPGRFPLAPLLEQAMLSGQVGGEYYAGIWYDVGTPKRLAELHQLLEHTPT